MNEAAAQLCFLIPALLTRRDELFPLARQVVRDSGYQYSKGHSRSQFVGGLPLKLLQTNLGQDRSTGSDNEASSQELSRKRPRVFSESSGYDNSKNGEISIKRVFAYTLYTEDSAFCDTR